MPTAARSRQFRREPPTGIQRLKTEHRLERRGLATPVRAENGERAAARHTKTQGLDYDPLTKADRDAFKTDHSLFLSR